MASAAPLEEAQPLLILDMTETTPEPSACSDMAKEAVYKSPEIFISHEKCSALVNRYRVSVATE